MFVRDVSEASSASICFSGKRTPETVNASCRLQWLDYADGKTALQATAAPATVDSSRETHSSLALEFLRTRTGLEKIGGRSGDQATPRDDAK